MRKRVVTSYAVMTAELVEIELEDFIYKIVVYVVL